MVLAKLWSVIPRLFAWPPARSVAQVLERVSLLMLVGGILFEIVTGVLNIQYDYIFGFSFYTAHYFGAWVFIAAFRRPRLSEAAENVCAVCGHGRCAASFTPRWPTRCPSRPTPTGLVAPDPDPPTLSRRGALAVVGGGALLVAMLTAGQTLGGFTRGCGVVASPRPQLRQGPQRLSDQPHRRCGRYRPGGHRFGPWRLQLLGGPDPVLLDRAALEAMPRHTVELPIACVEGWSTTQTWTGVRLADLAAAAGRPHPARRSCPRWSGSAPSITRSCRPTRS